MNRTGMLSGRRGLVTIQVVDPGDLFEIPRDRLLGLVQDDTEVSDILMPAFRRPA
jgi:hypothetical protein